MKKWLLLISFLSFNVYGYCQAPAGAKKTTVSKKTTTHHSKHHKTKVKTKTTQGEVGHKGPDQARVDSVKQAKTKLKQKK
jgi:hypothetical protein